MAIIIIKNVGLCLYKTIYPIIPYTVYTRIEAEKFWTFFSTKFGGVGLYAGQVVKVCVSSIDVLF